MNEKWKEIHDSNIDLQTKRKWKRKKKPSAITTEGTLRFHSIKAFYFVVIRFNLYKMQSKCSSKWCQFNNQKRIIHLNATIDLLPHQYQSVFHTIHTHTNTKNHSLCSPNSCSIHKREKLIYEHKNLLDNNSNEKEMRRKKSCFNSLRRAASVPASISVIHWWNCCISFYTIDSLWRHAFFLASSRLYAFASSAIKFYENVRKCWKRNNVFFHWNYAKVAFTRSEDRGNAFFSLSPCCGT